MAAVRILPAGDGARRRVFEGVVLGAVRVQLIGLIERLADGAAEQGTCDRAGCGRGELGGAMAELGAEQAAGAGAGDRPHGLFLAIAAAGAAGEADRHQR
jgi:hypothetical protein